MPLISRRAVASAAADVSPSPAPIATPMPNRGEKRFSSLRGGAWVKQFAFRLKANARWVKQFLHGGK